MKKLVSIIMGSDSDLEVMEECAAVLEDFGIPYSLQVMSAHRTPGKVAEYAASAARKGIKVMIAGAGAAAHLAGAVAANTTLPVIGVPLAATLNGFDALLSTVQMPAGIPVATVAVGSGGPPNAALFAVEILALSDERLRAALADHKRDLRDKGLAADAKLQAEVAAL